LKKRYNADGDEKIRATALRLIDTEDVLKYRKTYAGEWREK
jgi:hypothetical protein